MSRWARPAQALLATGRVVIVRRSRPKGFRSPQPPLSTFVRVGGAGPVRRVNRTVHARGARGRAMTTRDPEATKQRILAAALHEFSAKGISGARVDAIAERAKV